MSSREDSTGSTDPAYNADRGSVSIVSLRVHLEY
jgi:hypothetical protein